MTSKRTTGISFFLVVCSVLIAQDYHFSGFMQNMVYINPAYAAMPESPEIGITYRNQWPGIPATFVTYGAEFVMPVRSLSSGIGISITNDMQGSGVINLTSANLLYGYLIKLNRNWQVGTGLSASWVMKQFNADELVFRSDLLNDLGYGYGTVVYDNYSRSYPDFSIGMIARYNNALLFGVSAAHLTRPADTRNTVTDSRLPLKYTAFVSGRIGGNNRNKDFTVEPAAFFSHQQDNNELMYGSMVSMLSGFRLGAWLRQNLAFSFDALIVSAGFSWQKYNITYHYDVNLKKISFLSTKMAAHEVTFLYRFEYNDVHKVKRFRKSECPAY